MGTFNLVKMLYNQVMKSLLVFIYIFFLFNCQKSCTKQEKLDLLRIGTNASFVPFESVNAKGELEGFDIDLGYLIAETLGLKAEVKEFDFDALILALKKEQVDIVLSGLSITPSRQKEIYMVSYQGEPVRTLSLLFWQEEFKDIQNFIDLKELCEKKGLSVNVQAGHFLEDFLKKQNVPLKPLLGPPEQILDIKYQKSLAAAVDPKNAQKLSALHEGIKVVTLPLPEDSWDLGYGIGIKPSRKDLIEKIEKAILHLKEKGEIKRLEDKWLNKGQ